MGKSLIDEARVEKALIFLADTDAKYAQLKGELARAEYSIHLARKVGFFASEATTVRAKELEAEDTPLMKDRQERYATILTDLTALEAQRKRNIIVIDVFRTLEASRRVGNI